MKPYWGSDGGEWVMLLFAKSASEAKSIFQKHTPTIDTPEWIHIRVWRADDKWMKLYNGSPYEDSCGNYETWNEYWLNEHEN